MIATPTWATIPALGTTASKNTTGLDLSLLYSPGDLFPAEHLNQFTFWFSNNGNVSEAALQGLIAELQHVVTSTGQAIDPTDAYQIVKSNIANSHPVGELIWSEVALTPAIWTIGSATYLPVVARWDADHDVTSTQAPDLVTKFRAEKSSINVAGTPTSTFTGTVTGTNLITLTNTTANIALVTLIANEALANGYIATQNASFSAVYTGTAQRCLTLAGVEYVITSANTVSRTIGLGGSPPNATYTNTVELYPYRIAGSTTSVRLPRISGFLGVSQFDYDGVYVSGFRKMDQVQGHRHGIYQTSGASASRQSATGLTGNISTTLGLQLDGNTAGPPTDDTANGTPRTGKVTTPQTYSLYPYTWVGRLLT